MKKKRTADPLEAHEAAHTEFLSLAVNLAHRLVLVTKANERMAGMLAEARAKESGKLLCRVLDLENAPRRGATKGNDGRRPTR